MICLEIKGEKDLFITKWKNLEIICNDIFNPITGTPMDEIFTRYMYYERVVQGIKSSTTEALRKFYERDGYKLLKKEETLDNIIDLVQFWKDIREQDVDRFSDRCLRQLFILNYAPNGMWTYILSVYYMANRDAEGNLDDEALYKFLKKIIAFIWAYAVTNPGVNALRTPIFAEMINIVNKKPVEFKGYLFEHEYVETALLNYKFSNIRAMTKSLLTWWCYQNNQQQLFDLNTRLEIEHIYAKSRVKNENTLSKIENLESLGNKAILEKRINIRASDYRFVDKVKYYQGYMNNKQQKKEGTKNLELLKLAEEKVDFIEQDILDRRNLIIDKFMEYLDANALIK